MGQIADALKKLIENSEDLSTLPQLVAQVETLESAEEGYMDRIARLQEVNKSYLAQIPIPGAEPAKKEEKDETITFEEAQGELIKAMNSIGGN